MLVKPTRNWSVPFLIVPGAGKVVKADTLDLPLVAAQYLLTQRMVVPILEKSIEPEIEQPVLADTTMTTPLVEPQEVISPPQQEILPEELEESEVFEEDKTKIALELLNTAAANEIEKVPHIGKRTVEELIEVRPLSWEDAQALLTERQIASLLGWK